MVRLRSTMKGDKVKRDSSREWRRHTTCQENQNQAGSKRIEHGLRASHQIKRVFFCWQIRTQIM